MTKIEFKDIGEKTNWISGRFEDSSSSKTISIISPYFDKEIATIPDSNYNDLDIAVQAARSIFPAWERTNIRDRAEIMFRFKTILESNIEELAHLISLDNGKTIEDAKASINRGKEVVEFATSLPNILKGDSSQVADGITYHDP